MSQFWKDIRRSIRTLLNRPGFSSVCVLTLALGIGANTAIFSVVNAILLRQLPFRHAERIVWITGVRPVRSDAPFSLPDFLDYRDQVSSLDSLSAVGNWSGNLTGQGDTEQLSGVRVSANLFETLGVNAVLGRTLEPQDDEPGNPRVVVMSYGLWQRRFGSDSSRIGKPLAGEKHSNRYGKTAHEAVEWVDLDSVVRCAQVVAETARRFCDPINRSGNVL